MRRALKIVLWFLAGIVSLVVLVAVAALVVIQTPWFHNKVRDRIVYEIENATGGRAELRAFNFDWGTLTAYVRGLVIHGAEAAGEAPLFRADEIRVALKIVSIFQKRINLESVTVRRPQVNVVVYPDGRSNVPKPRAARKSKKSTLETVLDLAIRRFNLVNGTVQFSMRRMPLDIVGENLRAQIFYEPGPARYQGVISFRDLDIQAEQNEPLPVQVDARLVLFRNHLDISGVRLATRRSKVDIAGAINDFSSPRITMSYSAEVNLGELTRGARLGPLSNAGTIFLTGDLSLAGASAYAMSGHLRASGLDFRERGISIQNIRVDSQLSATPERIHFRSLKVFALGGEFDGAAEILRLRNFRVDGAVQGFSLQDATRLHAVRQVAWNGNVSGPVHLTGEVLRGRLAQLVLNADVAISPAAGENPVSGSVPLIYNRNLGTFTFGPSTIQTRFSHIKFSGVLGKKMDAAVETTNLDDAEPAIAMFTTGPPPPVPVRVDKGIARFQGSLVGPLKSPTIQGHAVMTNFITTGRRFDHAEADVVVSRSGVIAQNATVERLGMRAAGTVRVGFRDWRPEPNEPVSGNFAVRSPDLATVLMAANLANPFDLTTGTLTANVRLGGTIGDLAVRGSATALKAIFYGQPIDRIQGEASYTETLLEIPSAQLQIGSGGAQLSGRYEHPRGDWHAGKVRFQVASRGIYLADLIAVRDRVSGVAGRIEAQMAGEVELVPSGFHPGAFNGWVSLRDVGAGGQPVGSLLLNSSTKAGIVDTRLDGDVLGSKITGTAQVSLAGDYPARGRVDFTPLQFSTLFARLRRTPGTGQPPFKGTVAGTASFSGMTVEPKSWKGTIELPAFEVAPAAEYADIPSSTALILRNTGPIMIDVDSQGARVRQAQFRAKDTSLRVTGRVGFGVRNPWDLRVQGGLNLALLRDFEDQLYSSGAIALDVSVRGALDHPDVYGRIDVRNASLNFGTFPNGIDNANGLIFLYRDRAMIENLTAQSGGGKISVGGFISFAGVTTFHLTAKATDVRVRYPEGVSSTSNASLTFTGTIDRSVLSGDVTVTRVGFNPRSDLASILAGTAQPVQVPERPNRLEQGLRFDVRINTAPQVRFETQLTKDVQADANLRLRGDWTRPILLGRATINSGEIIFFGNRYTINSGQILFVNASKIEPTLNMDLETRVRGIDVTLHISGPVNKLNVSYRSDPPLQFSDIVALLATGRTPNYTALTGSQNQIGQNFEQAGASALLSQAIASPIAGRLQRFFGVSRLKIDPQVTGLTTSNAAARLTLEQNITNNLTFTYITDLSRAQAQTIQVEWDFTNNWSAVALREENGLFGIDFLYRRQLK